MLHKYPFSGQERGPSTQTTTSRILPTTESHKSSLGTKSIKIGSASNIRQNQSKLRSQEHQPSRHIDFPKPRWIFVVATTDRHKFKQILSHRLDTEAFGQSLRQVYCELKGFWRSWFSTYGFSHCDFARVGFPVLSLPHFCDKFSTRRLSNIMRLMKTHSSLRNIVATVLLTAAQGCQKQHRRTTTTAHDHLCVTRRYLQKSSAIYSATSTRTTPKTLRGLFRSTQTLDP